MPSDGNRYELVHRKLLVTPAPSQPHQIVLRGAVVPPLNVPWDRAEVRVFFSPADIRWADDVLVQPDVFVVPTSETTAQDWSSIQYATARRRGGFTRLGPGGPGKEAPAVPGARHGVSTYWIVDPDARVVEVWRPEDERPEIVTDVLRWRVAPGAGELEIDLAEIFKVPG